MISRERWQRLEPVLDGALDLPADEIPAYLDRVCAGEPEVRDEVARLVAVLREDRDKARFLDTPPAALTARFLSETDSATSAAGDVGEGTAIGPYRVLRRLGGGGMGVVYLARDPRLDRLVALKLLPPWLAADDVATRRLSEEAKAVSALDHPNLETVYDIGRTADGRPYIAMRYYEGETLADRIRRGPLPIRDAVALAMQLAQALQAAHARGIVHRDVKPANVIVTSDGVPKLVDFGVAKATGVDVTEPGATPGTVAYMSPEQTQGLTVDLRTDIWSLGVVLYEMLTGRRPFAAQAPDAVIYAIRHDQPEPLVRARSDVPEALARVVERCLEKDARGRYRDAASLTKALRHAPDVPLGTMSPGRRRRHAVMLIGGVLAATALVASAVVWLEIKPNPAAQTTVEETVVPLSHRIAVLPLIDSSAAPVDAYFADGLTEELITRLSSVRALRITALSSVIPYKGAEERVADVARRLGVGTLLLGGVREFAGRFRLSVRLVGADGRERWTDDYDADVVDVARVQRNVLEGVVAALGVPMQPRERRRLGAVGTTNADAYTEYLKARYHMEKRDSRTAREDFDRSLDLDPTFAAAWSGLARTYIQMSIRGLLSARDGFPRGREAAEHALELDPDLAEAHANLAAALDWYYWDTAGAEEQLRMALELDPSDPWAHRAHAVHLRNLGRFEQALSAAAQVRELDPLNSGDSYTAEGLILYMARRYGEAIEKYEQLERLDPANKGVYFYLALAYAQTGRYDQALAALQETDPDVNQPDPLAIRGYVLGRLGRGDEARRVLDRLDQSAAPAITSLQRALVYLGLGENERALALIEQAVQDRPWQLRMLKVEPVFDPLRDDPRFQALLVKLNLTG